MPNVSKKFITFFLLMLSLSASADLLRVEGAVGLFAADPGGSIEDKSGGNNSLDAMGIGKKNDVYAWVYLKHPIPIIPNARIEYLSLKHDPSGSDSFRVDELDGILYYNLLDDLLFVTLDLGVDLKYVQTDADAMQDETATVGLLYGRARVEPTEWLGFEALLKATNYGDNKGYDARLKVDYTMTFIPVIHPGVELGYRIHKIQYEIGDVINKAEYTGVYAGIMVRF